VAACLGVACVLCVVQNETECSFTTYVTYSDYPLNLNVAIIIYNTT
jgi:hypothetical protein